MRRACLSIVTPFLLLFNAPQFLSAQCNDSAYFTSGTPYCLTTAAAFTNLSTGATTSYAWNFGDPGSGALNTSALASPSHLFSAAGSYNVCLIANYANAACSDTFCSNVVIVDTINQSRELVINICLGTSAQLNITTAGATSYSWTDTLNSLSCTTCPNPVSTPVTSVKYVITLSNSACSIMDTVAVNVVPIPDAKAGNDVTICKGASTTLNASGGPNYSWSPTTSLSNPLISNPVASPTVTTTYTVTVSNPPCSNTATVVVTVDNSAPVITVSNDTTICNGASVNLNSTGATIYRWSPAAGLSNPNINDPVADPNVTTTYTVTASNAGQCNTTATVTLTVIQLPIANAGNDTSVCIGESVQLNASGGLTYLWSPSTGLSDSTTADPLASPTTTTSYTVTVSDGSVCPSSSDSMTVTVHPLPVISAWPDTTIIAGSSVTLFASGGINYTWSPDLSLSCSDCTNPVATPIANTTYIVTATDSFGCRMTDTVHIKLDDIINIFFPNAFTPGNQDMLNDVFVPVGEGIYHFELDIYNRWGQRIFVSTDPKMGWDGTYNGKMVPEDVYVYIAKATSFLGTTINKTGSVTVVR